QRRRQRRTRQRSWKTSRQMQQVIQRGSGCIRGLAARIRDSGVRRVLVLHGRTSFEASGVREILASLRGVDFGFFADVPANPELATVKRCLEVFKASAPDAVLAIGGGSVIDTAKAVIAFSSGALESDILANKFNPGTGRPHFWAAPTTAGSGSEATHFAVLYKDNIKYSIANQALKPDTVFLDPDLVVSCPVNLSLASGADAVCQAVESWWSRGATEESRSFSVQALSRLLTTLFRTVEEPRNIPARQAMLEGAHLAGRAIDLTKTTAGHALSYGLTSTFGLPHGLAVLAVMGPLVDLMDARHSFFGTCLDLDTAFKDFGERFVPAFSNFRTRVLSAAGVMTHGKPATSEADLVDTLVSGVNVERLSNHPVALTEADIAEMYQSILVELSGLIMLKDSGR
ncbi:MAG: phosphonoacetaldehyde reductase, partial [Spirochaetota bacterium]